MKILTIFTILQLAACATGPMLKVGSCYSVHLYDYEDINYGHELSSYKIEGIFEWKGNQHYLIQALDPTDTAKPLYPKSTSHAYARVKEFDMYMSPISTKVWHFREGVQCDPITRQEYWDGKHSATPPLYRTGDWGEHEKRDIGHRHL